MRKLAQRRHWRQRWDPKAPLIFRKRMTIGEGIVRPGDDVTDEHRKLLGLHRLRIWWDAEVLQLKDWLSPHEKQQVNAREERRRQAEERQRNAEALIPKTSKPTLPPEVVAARKERADKARQATLAARAARIAAAEAAAQEG